MSTDSESGHRKFRLIVPSSKVRSITGHKICEETGARIDVQPPMDDTTDQIVLVSGKEDPAMDAVIRIFQHVSETKVAASSSSASSCSISLLLDPVQATNLIGKNGSPIQEHNATVTVLTAEEHPPYAAANERVVKFCGQPSMVLKLLEAVVGHLHEEKTKKTEVKRTKKRKAQISEEGESKRRKTTKATKAAGTKRALLIGPHYSKMNHGADNGTLTLTLEQRLLLHQSIARYFERRGLSKSLKKFRSEAKIEKDNLEESAVDLEELYLKYLEICSKNVKSNINDQKEQGVPSKNKEEGKSKEKKKKKSKLVSESLADNVGDDQLESQTLVTENKVKDDVPTDAKVEQIGDPDETASKKEDSKASNKEVTKAAGTKKALLICPHYSKMNPYDPEERDIMGGALPWSHSLIEDMGSKLTKWFGFEKEDMKLLSDFIDNCEPTRETIEREISKLIANSKKNDRLYVYMTGHTITSAGELPSGIQTTDAKKLEMGFLKGIEQKLLKKKVRMTLFLDVCLAGAFCTFLKDQRAIHRKKWKNKGGGLVVFTSCDSSHSNREGHFWYSILRPILEDWKKGTTNKELFRKIEERAMLNHGFDNQYPGMFCSYDSFLAHQAFDS